MQIGNAFKTIFSRMGRVKDASILEETETTTASINDMEGALNKLGIALRDTTTGDFRDTGAVLEELSSKWNGMSKAEQSYIAELGAGVRQKNIFLALMESMSGEAERYTTLLGEATDAEGASADAQEIYMKSLEAKMNVLKTSTIELWQTLVNSDVIGVLVETLNKLVQGVTKVAEAMGSLGGHTVPIVTATSLAFTLLTRNVGGLLSTFTSMKAGLGEIKGHFAEVILGITKTGQEMTTLSPAGLKAAGAVKTLTGALAGIGIGLAISAVVAGIQWIASSAERAKEKVEALVDAFNQQSSKVTSIEKLIEEQEALNKTLDESKAPTEELLESAKRLEEVEKQIAEILPGATNAWTVYGEAKAGNIDTNRELLESEKEVLRQTMENSAIGGKTLAEKAEASMKRAVEQAEEAKKKIEEYSAFIEELESKKGTKGNSDFMLDQQIASYTDKINSLREKVLEHGATIKDNESIVNDYNKTIKKLNEEHGTSYQLVSSLSEIYQELGLSKGELAEETDRLSDSLEREQAIEEKVAEQMGSISESFKSSMGTYEDGKKAMSDLIDKSNEYRAILKDITDEQGNFNPDAYLSASTLQNIINNHEELVGYLGDEQALYDYMVGAMQNFGDEANGAYSTMMANSASYYDQNIKGTAEWEDYLVRVMNNLKKVNYNYYVANYEGMKGELQNAKSLAEARMTIEKNAIRALAEAWETYYTNLAINQAWMNNEFIGPLAPGQEASGLEEERKRLEAMANAMKDIIYEVDNIGISMPNGLLNSLTSPGSTTGSSSKNEVDDLELQIDRYYKLQKAINDVSHALTMNEKAQQTATGEKKIKLIEEEIALLEKQKKAYQDLRAEQLREISEKKGSLNSHGFNVDSNNQVTNYAQRLKELENWANSASGDEKKKRQNQVNDIKNLVDAFIALNSAVQDTDGTIADFDGKIQDNAEEMKDYYNNLLDKVQEVEDKITSALEKEIEKRRKAIEDEYNQRVKTLQKTKELYNKQNEEEDYKNELATEQSKLTELQNAINVAMRDTSNAGKARLAELQKQYQEQQAKIEGMITEHERDKANDRFDEEIEQANEERDKALESFDAKYDEKAIAQMVTELIANGWTQIGDEIINCEEIYKDFEDMFGEGLGILGEKIKEDFIGNLKDAQDIIKNMGDIYKALGLTTDFNGTGTREGSRSVSTFSLGGSTGGEAPMMARATTNPGLAQESIGTAVMGRAKSLEDIQVMGDTISNVSVQFDSLVNVQGNVMKDLIPQLNDVVQRAVKEMDKTITNNLKSRLGQL